MKEGAEMPPLVESPDGDIAFLNAPVVLDLDHLDADIAVVGVPHGIPYGMAGVHNPSSTAPAAIRRASRRFGYGGFMEHWDFDLDGPLMADRQTRIVDAGDVAGDPLDIPGTAARATTVIRALLDRGAIPIVLGGDDSIPIPVLRAYEGRGPLTLVQIDAHIDWRHEVDGVTEGYSSPMRRASEMDWIGDIIQVGIRGVGSARDQEVRDALAYGAKIVTARTVHAAGIQESVVDLVPPDRPCFITIDCDGLDPSVMPAVGAPVPGGLTFLQVAGIVQAVARKAPVAGLSLVELTPARDVNGISALTAARIIMNLIGVTARRRQVN
jgi:agmatinase